MALTIFFSIFFCQLFFVCIEIENNAIQIFIVLVWTWLFVSSVICRNCNLMYRLFLMSDKCCKYCISFACKIA